MVRVRCSDEAYNARRQRHSPISAGDLVPANELLRNTFFLIGQISKNCKTNTISWYCASLKLVVIKRARWSKLKKRVGIELGGLD
jgi:hypothetical protein